MTHFTKKLRALDSRTATQNLAQTRKGKKTAGKDFEIFRESA